MPAIGRKINLLPPSEFELSFWGKFLKWAVTTGRYIIVLTELVVICAFMSRFKLDNDISNLNSTIEGKKNVLEANEMMEDDFRTVQAKADAIGKVLQARASQTNTLDEITKSVPEEIKLDSLSINKTNIVLTAKTSSEAALGKLLAALNQSGKWKGVILSQVAANSTKGIQFTLDISK